MPVNVNYIITKLYEKGHTAYAVGGCIRDCILGKIPNDWDITTSATPDEIMNIFRENRTVPTGLQHGTVTVLVGASSFEVTTYRVDGEYFDGRRPESVSFTGDLKQDLNRRDFTINAMAYNEKDGLMDFFGGMEDLSHRVIRCVGDAHLRFAEDYLRMLRAYRFATVLGFSLEQSLVACCMQNKHKILNISAERIRSEIDKLIVSQNFDGVKRFFDDFSDVLFPEVFSLKNITQANKYHYLNVYDHTMEVLKNTSQLIDMRLTALFHDTGKALTKTTDGNGVDHFYNHQIKSAEIALAVMKRLKYDNKTINDVIALTKTHDDRMKPDKKSVRKLINRLGEDLAYKNLLFQRADVMGQSEFSKKENLPVLEECFKLYNEIINGNEPCTIGNLKVSGKDVIIELGIKQGREVGKILNYLLGIVLESPQLNDRETLIAVMKNLKPADDVDD